MRALSVEFVPRQAFPSWARGLVLSLLLLLAAHQGWQGRVLYQRMHQAEQGIVTHAAALAQAQQTREALEEQLRQPPPPYTADAATIAQLATLSLPSLLAALEAPRVPDIKLTTVDVSVKDDSVRVELEFADQSALMRYIDELNGGESPWRWRLQQAQLNATPGSNLPGLPTATLVSVGVMTR